jgi:nitrate reductase NapE component
MKVKYKLSLDNSSSSITVLCVCVCLFCVVTVRCCRLIGIKQQATPKQFTPISEFLIGGGFANSKIGWDRQKSNVLRAFLTIVVEIWPMELGLAYERRSGIRRLKSSLVWSGSNDWRFGEEAQ